MQTNTNNTSEHGGPIPDTPSGTKPTTAVSTPRLRGISESEAKHFVHPTESRLFEGVVYWINPEFGQDKRKQLSDILDSGGARPATTRQHKPSNHTATALAPDQKLNGILVSPHPALANAISRFDYPQPARPHNEPAQVNANPVLNATHVITPNVHFGEYALVRKNREVSVVTAAWVERSARFGRRYMERYFSARSGDIFSGMTVTATQMTLEDRETLLASVMALGGQWREGLRDDVTHLVLLNDSGQKYSVVSRNPEWGIKVILPHWFQECLNLFRIVPQTPYLFPDPPFLHGRIDRADSGSKGTQKAEADLRPKVVDPGMQMEGQDMQVDGGGCELPKPGSRFLDGYGVLVDSHLRETMSPEALERLSQRLSEAGAANIAPTRKEGDSEGEQRAAVDWPSVDILISQYRSGPEYTKATRLGKLVGSFVWLYQMFLSERVIPPTMQLLHYPVPPTGVSGMAHCVISTSNYTGAAKEYLKRLIIAMGAQYTPTLSRKNTHLVSATSTSHKYAKALEWNIHIVNHLWLEQCFRYWKVLTVSHVHYTQYPELPVFNSMVGETDIRVRGLGSWVDPAEAHESDIEDSGLIADPAHIAPSGPSSPKGSKTKDPGQASRFDNSESDDGVVAVQDSDDNNGGESDAQAQFTVIAQPRHSSRAAAMAASKTLGQMMQAANIFEREMRRERGRINSHRVRARPTHQAAATSNGAEPDGGKHQGETQKRKAESDPAAAPSQPAGKRHRANGALLNAVPRSTPVRLMFTQIRPTEDEERRILALGGEIVSSARSATHLVCVFARRTAKFLEALARGTVHIVQKQWMDDSLAGGEWIALDKDPTSDTGRQLLERYQLVDRAAEETWGFNLERSVRRSHERRMLEGVVVFVTRKTEPPFEVLRPLVEAAGGVAVDRLGGARLRMLVHECCESLNNTVLDDSTIPPLLVISCRGDEGEWPKALAGCEVPVYESELVLTGLLRQELSRSSSEFRLR